MTSDDVSCSFLRHEMKTDIAYQKQKVGAKARDQVILLVSNEEC